MLGEGALDARGGDGGQTTSDSTKSGGGGSGGLVKLTFLGDEFPGQILIDGGTTHASAQAGGTGALETIVGGVKERHYYSANANSRANSIFEPESSNTYSAITVSDDITIEIKGSESFSTTASIEIKDSAKVFKPTTLFWQQ